jgi:hypothetical protein
MSLHDPEEALLEILTCGSPEEASRAEADRRAMASFLSLNQDPALLTPTEVKQEGCVVRILYPPPGGIPLLRYQREILGGYPVPEDFALELGYQLSGALRVFLMPGAATLALQPPRLEEVFLTPEARLRLVPPLARRLVLRPQSSSLPPFADAAPGAPADSARRGNHAVPEGGGTRPRPVNSSIRVETNLPDGALEAPGAGSQAALFQGIGEILFALLTLEAPEAGKMSRARDFNRDLSPEGEALLKRLAEGGFGSLLALRSSLADCYANLTGAGPLKDGPLHNFRRQRVEICYAEEIPKAVASEEKHLEALRQPDFGQDYRLMTRLFGDLGVQANLRRLWWILGLSYLVVVTPVWAARLNPGAALMLWALLSLAWGSFATLIYFGYKRRRGVL